MQFFVHFALLVLRLTLSTGKAIVFLRICRFFVCTEFFVNIWCALVSRYSYLKKNSYHIWMNHCEHKIHHLTTTFRRNISYFVAYMWCSHRRFKNAVLPVLNASIQFNFSWFLIKWYVLAYVYWDKYIIIWNGMFIHSFACTTVVNNDKSNIVMII